MSLLEPQTNHPLPRVHHQQPVPPHQSPDLLVQPPAAHLQRQRVLIQQVEAEGVAGGSGEGSEEAGVVGTVEDVFGSVDAEEGQVLDLVGGQEGSERDIVSFGGIC